MGWMELMKTEINEFLEEQGMTPICKGEKYDDIILRVCLACIRYTKEIRRENDDE